MQGGGGPVGIISGPVAGGGGPAAIGGPTASGGPFAGASDEPDYGAEIGKNRSRSFVTIAIVLVMLLFLGFAALVAAGGIGYMIYLQSQASEESSDDDEARLELIDERLPGGSHWA